MPTLTQLWGVALAHAKGDTQTRQLDPYRERIGPVKHAYICSVTPSQGRRESMLRTFAPLFS